MMSVVSSVSTGSEHIILPVLWGLWAQSDSLPTGDTSSIATYHRYDFCHTCQIANLLDKGSFHIPGVSKFDRTFRLALHYVCCWSTAGHNYQLCTIPFISSLVFGCNMQKPITESAFITFNYTDAPDSNAGSMRTELPGVCHNHPEKCLKLDKPMCNITQGLFNASQPHAGWTPGLSVHI